jgi:hypothetical protein
MTEEECNENAIDPIGYKRFKPLNGSNWARLPGFEESASPYASRRLVARIAGNVHDWELGDDSRKFVVGPEMMRT